MVACSHLCCSVNHPVASRRVHRAGCKRLGVETTERIKQGALSEAERLKRPIRYLSCSRESKEDLARKILATDPVDEGLICVFTVLEPCMTFEYFRSQNRNERGLKLRP